MSGRGHPLPASDEARHGELPEHRARDKGQGDDARQSSLGGEATAPDGGKYPSGDLGRAPGNGEPEGGD